MRFHTLKTKKGHLTLKASAGDRDYFLHSGYDPLNESKRFIKTAYSGGNNVIVFGAGLGYHIKRLKEINPSCRVTVFEMFGELKEYQEKLPGVKYEFFNDLNGFKNKLQNYKELKNTEVLTHKPSLKLWKIICPELVFIIESYFLAKNSSYVNFKLASKNMAENKNTDFSNTVKINLPAEISVYAAGSSLDLIKNKIKPFGAVAAADTVYPALLNLNIIPDYVFCMDPRPESAEHFKEVDKKTVLVCPPYINKEIIEKFRKKYFFLTRSLSNKLDLKLNLNIYDDASSVTNFILVFLKKFQAKKIKVYGADFCYTNSIAYASDTLITASFLKQMNKFNPLETLNYNFIKSKEIIRLNDINGKNVFTHKNLFSYKTEYEGIIQNAPYKVYSLSYGLEIKGVNYV